MKPEKRDRIKRFVDDCRRLEVHDGGVTPIETTTRRIIEMGDAIDVSEARIAELEATLDIAVKALRTIAQRSSPEWGDWENVLRLSSRALAEIEKPSDRGIT